MAQESATQVQRSKAERHMLIAGSVLLAAALPSAVIVEDARAARVAGTAGLALLLLWAGSRALRMYLAAERAALPASVGRTAVPIAPARGFAALTFAVAVGLPLGVIGVLIALYAWAWLPLAAVLALGAIAARPKEPSPVDDYRWPHQPDDASELLKRLCMRADLPVPELIAEPAATANAWTSGGRIFVSLPLLELLDRNELEAVLAHEVAHLARRDAAVIEICSAPGRVLLAYATSLWRQGFLPFWSRSEWGSAVWIVAWLCVLPAVVVAWVSRLSMLGSSRAREHSADSAAAALTGRPSALASALLKLEAEREWAPSGDLRAVSVLCIVGTGPRRLGGLLGTHPSTARRVKRLEAIERRLRWMP